MPQALRQSSRPVRAERTTAAFTPAEVKTIGSIRKQVIHSPKIDEVFREIIGTFAAIRAQVAELDTPDLKIRAEISVDTKDQVIRLHLREEVTKVRSNIMRAISFLSSSNDVHTQSMSFSRRGVAHRSIPEPSTREKESAPPSETETDEIAKIRAERAECLRLLQHFHERLNLAAQEILK